VGSPSQQEPSAAIVTVLLVPDRSPELASLLRRVEAWVGERALDDVVFWLDGRGYLLRAHGLVGARVGHLTHPNDQSVSHGARPAAGRLRSMFGDTERTGILILDVPDYDLALDLVARLEDRWACCTHDERGVTVVVVFLSPDGDPNLAQLHRRVASWVSDHSLDGVTLRLLGSAYIPAPGSLRARLN
jgi:hypothetical protein